MKQHTFSFPLPRLFSKEDFVVSPANQEAFQWIGQWPEWSVSVICGPKGSGKTHLAHIWAERAGAAVQDAAALHEAFVPLLPKACIIDNIDRLENENALFHALNYGKEHQKHMLLTSRIHPNHLPFALPDVMSRLRALPVFTLHTPDDTLVRALLTKQFADRQLRIGQEVIDFLMLRMERSYSAIQQAVDALDDASLEQQRTITIPFIRTVLEY